MSAAKKRHTKFEESNALAAISRALVSNKDNEQQGTSKPRPGGQPRDAASAGETKSKKTKKRPLSQDGNSPAAGELNGLVKEKRRKEKTSKNTKLPSREGPAPALANPQAAGSDDPRGLCARLASSVSQAASRILAGSCDEAAAGAAGAGAARAGAAEAVDQALAVAARLGAALGGIAVASLAGRLEALQEGLRGLSDALQGSSSEAPLAGPHRQLLLSATALELATSAAQLAATSAAQHPLGGRDSSGPGRGGGSSSGRASNTEVDKGAFQQAYISSFADCFAAELEALQEAPAPAPAAAVRRCILGQAQLFSPSYQRLFRGGAD